MNAQSDPVVSRSTSHRFSGAAYHKRHDSASLARDLIEGLDSLLSGQRLCKGDSVDDESSRFVRCPSALLCGNGVEFGADPRFTEESKAWERPIAVM